MANRTPAEPIRTVGFWAAVLATVFSLIYDVGQLAEWLGLLGSQGGPSSPSTVLGIAVLLTPSIFLGSSFLILMVAIHRFTPPERRIWSQAALALATVYATLVSTVYFVQLTFVGPRLARGELQGMEPFLFTPFDSYLYAVDVLGYTFMCVSCLFASRVFVGAGLQRRARLWLTATGLLFPFLALQNYFHPMIWVAAAWAVTFPASTWTLALVFRRQD